MWMVVEWEEEKSVSVLKEKEIAKKGKENCNLVGQTVEVPLSGKDGFSIHKAKVLAACGTKTEALEFEKSLTKPADDCEGKRKRKLTPKAREIDGSSYSDDEVAPVTKKRKDSETKTKPSKATEIAIDVNDDRDEGDNDCDVDPEDMKGTKQKKKPKTKKVPPLQDKVQQERVSEVLSQRRNQALAKQLQTDNQQQPPFKLSAQQTSDDAPKQQTNNQQQLPFKHSTQQTSDYTQLLSITPTRQQKQPSFTSTPPGQQTHNPKHMSFTPTENSSPPFVLPLHQAYIPLQPQQSSVHTTPHHFNDRHSLTPLTTRHKDSWISRSHSHTSMLALLNDDDDEPQETNTAVNSEKPVPESDFQAYVHSEFQKLRSEISALKSEIKHLRKKKSTKEVEVDGQDEINPEKKLEQVASSFTDPKDALRELVFTSFTKEELKSKTIKGVKTWKCGDDKPEALDTQKLDAILSLMQKHFQTPRDKTKTMIRNLKRGLQYK